MFIFQAQAEKKEGGSDTEENKRFGMKVGKSADFLAAAMAMPDEQFAGALTSIDRAFKARGISAFMNTLTPGAQNAIYASSFVWGYAFWLSSPTMAKKVISQFSNCGSVSAW